MWSTRCTVLSVRRDGVEADVVDQMAEGGETAEHICRLCEQDHCGCGHEHVHVRGHDEEHGCDRDDGRGHAHDHADGHDHGHDHADGHGHDHDHGHASGRFGTVGSIVKSAVSHTVQVSLFIFLVTFALVLVLETVGEDALAAFLSGNQLLAVFASALVGLVPNCSASVVITQLYLEGVLAFAPLMAGLLTSAGVGYLVLFRTNRHPRENAVIVAGLFLVACVWGLVFSARLPVWATWCVSAPTATRGRTPGSWRACSWSHVCGAWCSPLLGGKAGIFRRSQRGSMR